MTLDLGYALSSIILISFFLATLLPQLLARRYHPALYWSVILSTTMAGTTMSDFMDRTLDVGYVWGSLILLAILLAIFAVWRAGGESLAVEKIRTRKVETLYWTAILFSNTLGTAVGDFFADTSGLGFGGSALLIGSVLALAAAAAQFTRISRVFLFWLAFVLTRPLGATIGDLFTKSHEDGGLGIGTIPTSIVLLCVLALCVAWATWTRPRIAESA